MKRVIKKILAITVVTSMLIAGVSCSKNEEKKAETEDNAAVNSEVEEKDEKTEVKNDDGNKDIKVAFLLSERDQFMSIVDNAFLDEAKALGVEATSADANKSIDTQISQVQQMAASGYDAIAIHIANTESAQQIVDAAGDMHVVFLNRGVSIPMEKGKTCFVGSKETDAGALQGEYLVDFFKKEGKTKVDVIMLQGELGLQNTIERTESALKALEDGGLEVNVVLEQTAEWNREKAQTIMQLFLGKGDNYDCVIANNDEMAIGAISAISASGVTDFSKIPVVAIDATVEGIKAMEEDTLAMSAYQNASAQGSEGLKACVKLAKGEDTELEHWIPFEKVTKENAEQYK